MLLSKSTRTGQRSMRGNSSPLPFVQGGELHRNPPSCSISPDPHRGQIREDETVESSTNVIAPSSLSPGLFPLPSFDYKKLPADSIPALRPRTNRSLPALQAVTPYGRNGPSSRVRVFEWLDRLECPAVVSGYISHHNA